MTMERVSRIGAVAMMMIASPEAGPPGQPMGSGRAVLNQSLVSGQEIQPLDPAPKPAMHGRKRPFRARHGLPRSPDW